MENKEKEMNQLIYSQETIEFVTVANEYCKIIENLIDYKLKNFIEHIYKISSLLLLKTLNLEKPNIKEKLPVETFINEADWHYIDTSISTKLGEFEVYTEIREPAIPDNPINISMSECLADIYQDLKDFTKIYSIASEDVILNALEDCLSNFEQIWGPRLLTVMKEFHNLLYGNNEISEEIAQRDELKLPPQKRINNLFTGEL